MTLICVHGSNEYPHSMFWTRNKENRYTPAVLLYIVGFKSGVYISRTCFPDVHVFLMYTKMSSKPNDSSKANIFFFSEIQHMLPSKAFYVSCEHV